MTKSKKDKKTKAELPMVTKSVAEQVKDMSSNEKGFYDTYMAKVRTLQRPPKFKLDDNSQGLDSLDLRENNVVSAIALGDAFGTTSDAFVNNSLSELINAACRGSHTKPFDESAINSVIAAMTGLKPQDELEGMLASQMVATHFAAMRQLRSTKNSETISQQDSNGNLAIKLMRTFATQLEALQKYRGKGQQKMTVEHVHVNAGGQAIIGNVHNSKGGVDIKTEEQPLATVIEND